MDREINGIGAILHISSQWCKLFFLFLLLDDVLYRLLGPNRAFDATPGSIIQKLSASLCRATKSHE